jgi:hypothetical protein
MCVCLYICMCVLCMYVCMYVCVYMCVCMYVCMCTARWTFVFIHSFIHLRIYLFINYLFSLPYYIPPAPPKATSPHSLTVCPTTYPQPLPKPVLHAVQSSASCFNLQYHIFFLTPSSSCLCIPPLLPVTSILASIACSRRQLLFYFFGVGGRWFVLQGCYISYCKGQRVGQLVKNGVEKIWKESVVTKSRYILGD